MNTGIYQILNQVNGKSYVGSAVSIIKRQNAHRVLLLNNQHYNTYLQHAWNKYGKEAWQWNILEYVPNSEWLLEIEQYWIDFLETAKPAFGYNILAIAGRPIGYKHTDEAKRKMSQFQKNNKWSLGRKLNEEHKRKISEAQKGRVFSSEHKQRMSEALKGNQRWLGRKHTEETKRKISEAAKGNQYARKL
jgi:group I intron endonuclease